MFFILSKVFWAVFAPLTFISLMIIGGWATRAYKCGRKLLGAGIILLILCGFFPIGHNLLVFWENKYPPLETFSKKVDGIIVLGGAIDFKKSFARGQGQLNEHAPRITEMMALAKQYPKAKIVLSGGNGNIEQSLSSEAKELDKLLNKIDFNTSRIIYEGKSRNTFENMEFSKKLLNPQQGEVWLLVTSAFHMPRSEAIFKTNGWNVTPYPAGYLTDGQYRLIPNFEVLENMYKLQIVTKEMIGIMAYHLTGKIKSHDEINTPPLPAGVQ